MEGPERKKEETPTSRNEAEPSLPTTGARRTVAGGTNRGGASSPSRRAAPPPGRWARRRWLRFDSTAARWRHRLAGVVLLFLGLTVAIANGAVPAYQATPLALSGYFFALADSGSTLYAASEDGGAVLLEKSVDRGLHWSTNPVPYPAVAGGYTWDIATVASDGSALVMAAASGQMPAGGYGGGGTSVGVTCGSNSTVLLASSPDGGVSWSTSTFSTPGLTIVSLQAGILGNAAGVAWLARPSTCPSGNGFVQAVTSADAGTDWGNVENLSSSVGPISPTQQLEMAAEGVTGSPSLVLAFQESAVGGGPEELALWAYATAVSPLFQPYQLLTAPASWTLQGNPDSAAFLVTPAYLIPLTGPAGRTFTAIPFSELQVDGGGVAQLPQVLSLIPAGTDRVEIAATQVDGAGVDCWQVDYLHGTVEQTCHVPLGSLVTTSSSQAPIVALLEGGGWWVAVGAGGEACFGTCGGGLGGGLVAGGTAAPASPAVGTSICHYGCGAANGLVAYAFTESTPLGSGAVDALAGLLLACGAAFLFGARVARFRRPAPRGRANAGSASAALAGSLPPLPPHPNEPRQVVRAYRRGLMVWLVAWAPLALLAFVASSAESLALVAGLAVAAGCLGAVMASPFQSSARRMLQRAHGVNPDRLFSEVEEPAGGYAADRVRLASFYAYSSWVLAFFVFCALAAVLIFGAPLANDPGYGTPPGSAGLGVGAWFLLGALVLTLAFRMLYHLEMAGAVRAVRRELGIMPSDDPGAGRAHLRETLGALLLPLNPFAGLLIGFALLPVLPGGPLLLAWAFLPATLLGIALLRGMLGQSTWNVGDPAAAA